MAHNLASRFFPKLQSKLREAAGTRIGGTPVGPGGIGTGVISFSGGGLATAARLAATQPGLSRDQFVQELRKVVGDAPGLDVERVFAVYRQLISSTGTNPQTAEEVTSPEPEGPGRFQATRPGDLLGAGALRFGA